MGTGPPECEAEHLQVGLHPPHLPQTRGQCYPPAQLNLFPLLPSVSVFEYLNVLALHQILCNHAMIIKDFLFYTDTLNFDIESCISTQ